MNSRINKSLHALLAAIIERAIDDLKEIGPRCRRIETDQAMAFILSETCEAYCLELEINYEAIKEKAAELYRKILESEQPIRKPRKPINVLRRIQLRQNPGERRSSVGG
ncbi:MAG: hypothetical protein LBU66_08505 [Treponema sp.]|nr:hypothetical protein [Treponema sp.]